MARGITHQQNCDYRVILLFVSTSKVRLVTFLCVKHIIGVITDIRQ